MEQIKIDRINELAHAAKERELTDDEKAERFELRQEYLASVKNNIRAALGNITVVDEKGKKKRLEPKNPKQTS